MERGFFITGVAGQMAQNKLDNISHNLANANTTGYKADRASFFTMYTSAKNKQGSNENIPAAYLKMGDQFIDTRAGSVRQTGADLDFAIVGDGYFQVQAEGGDKLYTRAGNFQLDGDGNLRTQNGLSVLDSSGSPITLPPGVITSNREGGISVDGNAVAQLGLVTFNSPTQVSKADGTMFSTPDANVTPANGKVTVMHQALEDSNVNSVMVMAEMVDTMRSYEAMMKVVEQYNQLAGQISDQVARVQG